MSAHRVVTSGSSQTQHSGTQSVTGTGQPSQGLQIITHTSTFGGGGQRSFPQQPKRPASAWLEPNTTTRIAAAIEIIFDVFTLKLLSRH